MSSLLPPRSVVDSVAAHYRIKWLKVFGSRARGDARPKSGLDLLVKWHKGTTLLDVIGFEQELSELLGYPVETSSIDALAPHLEKAILAEARFL